MKNARFAYAKCAEGVFIMGSTISSEYFDVFFKQIINELDTGLSPRIYNNFEKEYYCKLEKYFGRKLYGKNVLEIGPSHGAHSLFLPFFGAKLWLIEIDGKNANHLKNTVSKFSKEIREKIYLLHDDCLNIHKIKPPFSGKIDFVIMAEVYEHLPPEKNIKIRKIIVRENELWRKDLSVNTKRACLRACRKIPHLL